MTLTRLPMTEAALMRAVLDMARLFGWMSFHQWTSVHSARGAPDLIMVRPPRVIFAELKRETGKVSEFQRAWLDALGDCPGVETYLWRPEHLDDGTIERSLR